MTALLLIATSTYEFLQELDLRLVNRKVVESLTQAGALDSLDGNRAQITVVSDVFADMSRVKKQQAVYAAISDYIADGRLHAVTIDARTVSG